MRLMSPRIALCSIAMSQGVATPDKPARVVFVCEHGSVKSLIAMDYFNRSARERGLAYRAVARGTAPEATVQVMERARDNGLLIGTGGLFGNVLRLSPMLNISKADVDEGVRLLDKAFSEVRN